MGWVEFMKGTTPDDEGFDPAVLVKQMHTICDDMENDITRLRKITNRFSQIGSTPVLIRRNVNAVVEDAKKYLAMRLPLLKKRIELVSAYGELPEVAVNRDLLEWVFENLTKNSIDAITGDRGKIEIKTEYVDAERLVRVSLTDNGKGISWENQKKVFSPGYTTKKRGWGLGLTLAKRIVEDYHGGRIYVKWSQKNKGTVICVDLPVARGTQARRAQGS
jgi:signal transduction histidine kinase